MFSTAISLVPQNATLCGIGLKVIQMMICMICIIDWVKNIVGKGENAGYQHFLLFPPCFQRASFPGSLKVGIEWLRVKTISKKRKFPSLHDNN